MLFYDYKIPTYLTEKKNITSFVVFTAIFALVFINVYSPFGSDKWLKINSIQFVLYSSIVVLIGVLVIAVSRFILYFYQKNKAITYKVYGLWILIEIFSMALVYAAIQYYNINIGVDIIEVINKSFKITALVLLPSYVIYWLYASLIDKYKTIELLQSKKEQFTTQSKNINTAGNQTSMQPFYDNKNILKFSVKKDDLLYVEADDNYIVVHYVEQNKINKYMIRNSLKRIEEELSGSGLVRCHRSFMVNFEKVKVIKKAKEGMMIEFDHPSASSLPVSKTYVEQVVKCFYENSNE